MQIPIDYDTLRAIWWGLLGVLFIAFAVFDGFDLGMAILLPFVARRETDRRILINTVGPVWEANQVWFLLAGGASFAAWPPVYAVTFSGFYLAMFLALVGLILRPVAFKYRGKVDHALWRALCDWALFFGGVVPTLIFGVAFGNLLQGVPFHFDENLRIIYTGGFFELLNPFALLCGAVSLAMLSMHGAAYIALKTGGALAERARLAGVKSCLATAALFAIGGICVSFWVDGYAIVSPLAAHAPSNPLRKAVESASGLWLQGYAAQPWRLAGPVLAFVGALLTAVGFRLRREGATFAASAITVIGVTATPGLAMFPFLVPSSAEPNASLTAWDSSSSQATLFTMLVATAVLLPIVLAYTAFVYRVLRGKIGPQFLKTGGHAY